MDSDSLEKQLKVAIHADQDDLVLDLLQRGVNPNDSLTLQRACYDNHPCCAELLIKWGTSVKMSDYRTRRTPLHWACDHNSMDCVRLLMHYNSPTDIKDKQGRTAVDLARAKGNHAIAEFIIAYNPLLKDPLTTFPSYEQLGQLRIEQWLKLGAHLHLSEDQLKTSELSNNPTGAVLIAAKINNLDLNWKQVVEGLVVILEYKLAESLCSEHGEGYSALAVCAFYCWLDFLKYLIDTRGLNPNNPANEAGDTVASIACIRGHIVVIDYLVKNKYCDPDGSVNAAGDTLRTLASSYGISNIVKYLENRDIVEQQSYVRILDEMMCDQQNTILIHYQKLYFIGSSGLGKSTTRKRLTGIITNLASLPEEERERCSTNLAECTQVLALMSDSGSKLTLQVSDGHDEETRMLFAYMYSSRFKSTEDTPFVHTSSYPSADTGDADTRNQEDTTLQMTATQEPCVKTKDDTTQPSLGSGISSEQLKMRVTVDKVIARLRLIVGSGKYAEQLQNKILLNLVDVGGQPGFLEMLPFLSKGPGMFLAFFRLDKDLDEPCEVSFERGENRIAPYKAIYTIRETLSQILASINHHITFDSPMDPELQKKLGDLATMKPVATLIGTFKDKLETNVRDEAIMEKLSTTFPEIPKSEKKELIEHAVAGLSEVDVSNDSLVHSESNIKVLGVINTFLHSKSFEKEVKDRLDQELDKKNKSISTITCHFEDLLIPTADDRQFIAIDNFAGLDADIDPLREHLQGMFLKHFRNAKLRIRPPQLLLGVILRKEYEIVSMDDCIHIGRALNMVEEEVKFSVWYLDRWVGALIYHPEIEDEDHWFKKNIICSPQVVFDSISSLIVETLLELHSPVRSSSFTVAEKKNWVEKGQFSLDTVKHCHSRENEKKVKEDKLIPVDKLVKLLEHSNLLSTITTKKRQGGRETEKVMYFIPAILECASHDELTKSPSPDTDTPSPVKITFESGYVPIGVFCAMISQLVSRGSEGILGMRWELVESGVKKNLVSFRVDAADHIVILVAHADCYEIRIIRQDRLISLHELCSYVLSTILYVMKEFSSNIRPIISFDCPCSRHQCKGSSNLCQLSPGVSTCFKCNHRLVQLSPNQECWLTKEATLGDCASLVALPFADEPRLSFKWIKKRPLNCSENEFFVEKVTRSHCEGYYTCEIIKDGKPLISVYYRLKVASATSVSDKDQLLNDVRQATKEVRADWYSLAIELDINYGLRKAIQNDYRFVDVCFHTMLKHWLSKPSPLPTLVRALRSKAVAREDIAHDIEILPVDDPELKSEQQATPRMAIDLQGSSSLNVDKHLKVVREVTWDVRSQWYNLGLELGISVGTLQMLESDYQNQSNTCWMHLLELWLTGSSSPPTCALLIAALKRPAIDRGDVATDIQAMLEQKS